MTDILTTPWPPDPGSGGVTEKPRTIAVRYTGDAQREIADGIQNMPVAADWLWVLPPTDALTLITFFRNHRGKAFFWAVPGEPNLRTWQATHWVHTVATATIDQVQVSFEETFMR